MTFCETLTRRRKALGLSQEALAARIQVSRQAVSKWETGDAAPDLPRLLALADALEISLDTLCGRAAEAEPGADAEAEPAPGGAAAPRPRRRVVLPLLLAAVLLGAAFWAGTCWPWNIDPAETAPAGISTLPETLTVSGVNFLGTGGGLSYRFTPSIAGENYAYQITFAGFDSPPYTFDAPYSGGVCAGEVPLSGYDSYAVTVLVSEGVNSRSLAVAENLSFSETGASWTPSAP